jgi:hypothetical protein
MLNSSHCYVPWLYSKPIIADLHDLKYQHCCLPPHRQIKPLLFSVYGCKFYALKTIKESKIPATHSNL